jgi:hypothetical protein
MILSPKVGQYVGVTHDKIRKFKGKHDYRIMLYNVKSAYGLIGTEYNGIAIVDETEKTVICDGIMQGISGCYWSNGKQIVAWQAIVRMPFSQFKAFVNNHDNTRSSIA